MSRPAVFLALALAAAAAAASARTFELNITAGATVRIGFMTPSEKLIGDPSVNEYLAAMRLLEQDVNGGKHAALLPNHTLEIVHADTTNDAYRAPYAFDELVEAGVAAVVGPTHHEEMMLASAYASTLHGVTQVGRSSAAAALSDKTKYPFYSRLTGSLESEASRMVSYLKGTIGWDRVGVFCAIDTATVEFLNHLVTAASAQGVEVVQPVQFPLDALDSDEIMSVYTDLLKASGARVIVTLVPQPHDTKALDAMRLAGLARNEYTLVLPSVTTPSIEDSSYPYVFDSLIGSLYMAPLQFLTDDASLLPFANRLVEELYGAGHFYMGPAVHAIDIFHTRLDYDSALLVVQAASALVQMKQLCVGQVAGVTVIPTCQALFADGSDDASLTRLVRSIPLVTNEAGIPVFLHPNGDRATTMTVLQIQGSNDTDGTRVPEATEGRAEFAAPHLVMPDGSVTPYIGALKWQDGTDAVPLDEAVVSYELERVSLAVFAAMSALAGLACAFGVACVVATLAYRRLSIMRLSSYRVNCLSAVGGAVLLVPVFLGRLELSGGLCTAKVWLTSAGFTLLFAPMFAKLWRVHRIFGSKRVRAVRVSDSQLLSVVALLLLVDAVVLGAWNAAAPQEVERTTLPPVATANPNLLVSEVQEQCSSSLDHVFYPLVLAAKAALLVFGSYLAYSTRAVKIKALNDSKWIGMSVYTTSVIALLTLPVVYLVGNDSADATYVLMSGPFVVVVATSTALIFLPKLAAVWGGTTEEWVHTDATAAGTTGGSTRTTGTVKNDGLVSVLSSAAAANSRQEREKPAPAERAPAALAVPHLEMGALRLSTASGVSSSQPCSPMAPPSPTASGPGRSAANEV